MYERGIINEGEALHLIVCERSDELTPQEISEVPLEWADKIRAEVDRMPTTDEEWSHSITIGSWCCREQPMPPTQEEYRAIHKKSVEIWREKVCYLPK